jgi:hypothetical protein
MIDAFCEAFAGLDKKYFLDAVAEHIKKSRYFPRPMELQQLIHLQKQRELFEEAKKKPLPMRQASPRAVKKILRKYREAVRKKTIEGKS